MRIIERLSNAWKTFRADAGGSTSIVPWDDYWYGGHGVHTATGLKVSPESALRVAAVFACVRVVSETVASLPLIVYKRLPNGGKERAIDHPLYNVLHNKPNQWQTAYEWLEMMQAHLELRGNAFSVIVPGQNGAVDQLVPIHPDRVNVYRMSDGRLKYQVRNFYNAETKYYMQEEMFHVRALSSDGLVGMSTVSVGAETISAGLAAQEFAGRFFENGASPSGAFTAPKGLNDAQFERYKRSIKDSQTGENAHKIIVLEEGMTYTAIGVTNKDSQLLEARQFSRGDIASMWRVPPHKIGDLSRATFSNIEQQNIEFATDCIRPRLVRLERRVQNDLLDPLQLPDGNEYFCEFLMDALLRGDLKSRYEAYAVGRQWGWLSANDVCSMENRNPIGPGGDQYLVPLNMVPGTIDNPDASDQSVGEEDSTATSARSLTPITKAQAARLKEFAMSAAERLVRKEVKEIGKLFERSENGQFADDLESFYEKHAGFLSEAMHITPALATAYLDGHKSLFEQHNAETALVVIGDGGANELACLALKKCYLTDDKKKASSPLELKLSVEQSNNGKRSMLLTRDASGRVEKAEVNEAPKVVTMTRDKDGRVETLDLN